MAGTVRIKICGLASVADARQAVDAGADALGLVFYPPSPRCIDIQQAAAICRAIPAFVSVVGLFMNPSRADVASVLDRVPLELLQFHGHESGAFCRSFGRRYLKAVGMAGNPDMAAVASEFADASALLVDSHAGDRAGGSGERFDWDQWPALNEQSLILAGGLNPDNVAEAVTRLTPWGVDVSSGVESAPGRKDPAKMNRFVSEVHRVCKSQ